MRKIFLSIIIFFVSNSLYAFELRGTFYQGNLIIGKTEPKSKVFIDKKKVKVSDQGFFAFGLSKNRKNDVLIEVIKNDSTEKLVKKVYKKKYLIQKINGLPGKKLHHLKSFTKELIVTIN